MTSNALAPLAQEENFAELSRDPVLVVAAVLLVAVCIMWIVVAPLITRNLRKAAMRRKRRKGPTKPNFTMWDRPP